MAGWLDTLLLRSAQKARFFSLSTTLKMPTRCQSSTSNKPQPSDNLENTIEISESCVKRLTQLGNNKILRIAVDGGGCSGFQYKFELDTAIEDGDHVFRKSGACVVVDEASLQYLRGATIDYHTELIRSAFRVVNNPMAEQGCSCGSSFNIKV